MDSSVLPSLETVWQWLDEVLDPEIPVISLVDLGVIREVRLDGPTLVVVVTPTYSGCPATAIINEDIEAALRRHGVTDLRLERRLSPPWSTDWLSDRAREQLRQYGITPPRGEGDGATGVDGCEAVVLRPVTWQPRDPGRSLNVPCPRCGSDNTTRVSQFGSTPCKASYRCLDCLEPFDYFKRI